MLMRARARSRVLLGAPLTVAALTAVVLSVRLGGASLWEDELYTWTAAHRSWAGTWRLGWHGETSLLPYYLLMHAWASVSTTEWWLRAPSVVGMAVAAGFTVDLGRRWFGTKAGVAAGLILAVLPATTMIGQMARPYGLAIGAAVAAVWFAERAVRSGRGWVGYAGCLAAAGMLHFSAVAVVGAVAGLAVRDWATLPRRRLLLATVVGCGPALLLLGKMSVNDAVPSWMDSTSWGHLREVLVVLVGSGTLLLLVAALAVAGLVLRGRSAAPAAVWALGAPLLVLAYSLHRPVLTDRYFLVCLPALCLLAGAACARLPWKLAGPLIAAVALIGVPVQDAYRQPAGYAGQDWRGSIRLVRSLALPADAVFTQKPGGHLAEAYYGPVNDPTVVKPATATDWYHPVTKPNALAGVSRLWWIGDDPGHADDIAGWRVAGHPRYDVFLLERLR